MRRHWLTMLSFEDSSSRAIRSKRIVLLESQQVTSSLLEHKLPISRHIEIRISMLEVVLSKIRTGRKNVYRKTMNQLTCLI